MECVASSLIIVGGLRCSSPISVHGVRSFFYNYCWWSTLLLYCWWRALFLHYLLLVEYVVSSSLIIGGVVRCFFFNYYWWSALFLL